MLYGLPACALAGLVPPLAPVMMAPVGIGVRWIDAVGTVGAAAEPALPWSWLGWLAVTVAVAVLLTHSTMNGWLSRCLPCPGRTCRLIADGDRCRCAVGRVGGDTARARQSPPSDGSSPHQRNEVQRGKTDGPP